MNSGSNQTTQVPISHFPDSTGEKGYGRLTATGNRRRHGLAEGHISPATQPVDQPRLRPDNGLFDVEERIEIFIVNLQSERVTLEAEMMFRDAPVVDGTQVTFAVDSGSFAADEEVPEITLDARGGKAEVTLFQDCNGGPQRSPYPFEQSIRRRRVPHSR